MYPLAAAAAEHSPTRPGMRRPITLLGSLGSPGSYNLFANNFEVPVDFSAMARETYSKERRQLSLKENNRGSPNKKEGKYCMVYRIDLLLILWGFKLNTVCMLILAAAHDTVDIGKCY